MSIPLIYVAGPYRAPTTWEVQKNIHSARMWGAMLTRHGAYPVIPHSNTANFDGLADDDFWLAGTMALMRACDGVFLTDGWTSSSGSRAEQAEAIRLGIPTLDGQGWSNRGGSNIHLDVQTWIDHTVMCKMKAKAP